MRILHTADWHLGHTLRDHSRRAEHEHFLAWLVRTIVERDVDALLIAGDVFDAANPSPDALRTWFRFLGELKRARPAVQVVVIPGNHDSAARLVAPRELLAEIGVRVVPALARGADGTLEVADLLVPLRDRAGDVAALCVAIPFLRSSDVQALLPPAPIERPSERPVERLVERSAERPIERPIERLIERRIERPAEPAEQPAERTPGAAPPAPSAAVGSPRLAAPAFGESTRRGDDTMSGPAGPARGEATASGVEHERGGENVAPEPVGRARGDGPASRGDYVLPRPEVIDRDADRNADHDADRNADRDADRDVDRNVERDADRAGAADADEPDPVVEGMRALHREVFAAARAALGPGQALVAMAHGYLVGGALSELSERKVLGGNQHALPIDLFPPDCAYVALGHLHRPQALGGVEHVRYSGSPIPLSMPERLHAHHVVFADLDGARLAKTWSLRVPRLVPLLRVPEHGALEPDAALDAVAQLPPRDAAHDDELRPLLEIAVRLPQPSPHLAERLARACADRDVRLVRIDVSTNGGESGGAAADGADAGASRPTELQSLQPEEVFARRYAAVHSGPVPEPLLAAFRELLDAVEHGGARAGVAVAAPGSSA